jgi:hypothetical protein
MDHTAPGSFLLLAHLYELDNLRKREREGERERQRDCDTNDDDGRRGFSLRILSGVVVWRRIEQTLEMASFLRN